jgi:hypothetical protein
MKSKMHPVPTGDEMQGNAQVLIEIQTFLQALDSYPDRFSVNPRITFEEYCSRLVETAKIDPRRRA